MSAARLNLSLAALAVALALAALAIGPAPVPPSLVWDAVTGGHDGLANVVLSEIRLPRAILGAAIGASLGLAGAVLQGLLHNPLAEPGLIGASPAAAFGAALAFYFGLAGLSAFAVPVAAMAGAAASVVLLYALAGRDPSMLSLVLAGVAVSSFAGALTALALNLAPSPFAALEIAFWLLGSLADRSLGDAAIAVPLMALGWALLATTGRGLDALSLGEDAARSLGIDLDSLRLRIVAGVALAVGAAVSVSGAIGFVGLVVPHLVRPLVGHAPGRLLLPSALGGAALVLAADLCVRLVPTGIEIKLGVVTALIGAPFFLSLVLSTRRTMR
jgi:iron complex transport system permease protein